MVGSIDWRISLSAGQSKRRCCTVSYGWGQSVQCGSFWGCILFRWKLRGMCCVRRRKRVTCFFLSRRLRLSFGFGVVMCWKTFLPVFPRAHSFSHSSFLMLFIICLALVMEVGRFFCSHRDPCLASVSAFSFPGMLVCPGIHWSVIWTWCVVLNFAIVLVRLRMYELSFFSFSRDHPVS